MKVILLAGIAGAVIGWELRGVQTSEPKAGPAAAEVRRLAGSCLSLAEACVAHAERCQGRR